MFAFLGLWVAEEKTKVYLRLEVVRSRDREINGSLGWGLAAGYLLWNKLLNTFGLSYIGESCGMYGRGWGEDRIFSSKVMIFV